MSNKKANQFRLAKLPYHIKLAMLGVGLSSHVMAQTDDAENIEETVNDDVIDEIITTGVRGSLQSSQLMKQNSHVFVDGVTAEDIGALPDRSITEVLQRIPGVAMSRFSGSSDPDHFSAEGSGTIVRGLSFVRSELNGRDVFTADSGQALGFSNVSPELMQSVQVFKTQSADMIEGGIGGSVNLVTRKPFDKKGTFFGFSAETNYSDLREESSPGFSGLASGRWMLAGGSEFGAMISAAYSDLKGRSDGTLVADWVDEGRGAAGQSVPSGAGIRTSEYDRERTGIAGALQWANADETVEATFQFFNSTYDNKWNEKALEPGIDSVSTIIPRPGTSFTFGSDGLFESGVLSEPNVGWRGDQPSIPLTGMRQVNQTREQRNESSTDDYALNIKFSPRDDLHMRFEVQRVESEVTVEDYSIHGGFMADIGLDMRGDVPQVTYVTPVDAPNQTDYFDDLDSYYIRSMMDHNQDNEGEETAVRGDIEFDFSGDSFIDSVQFGARFAKREQTVRFTTYQWGNVSNTWSSPYLLSMDPSGSHSPYTFDNYQRGNAPGMSNVPFYSGPMTADALRDLSIQAGGAWRPVQDRPGVIPGTAFQPEDIYSTEQETTAAYVRMNFSTEMSGGTTIDGNLGIRVVNTDQSTIGFLNYPDYDSFLGGQPDLEARCTPLVPGDPVAGFCYESPETQASYAIWADNSGSSLNDSHDYTNVLPSLTVKIGLDDERLIRIGASSAISRPDFGLLKSFYAINMGDDDANGNWRGPQAQTSNVQLEPIESRQFDISYEWYFDKVGSLTVSGFHKTLRNYIVPSVFTRSFENNGESFEVDVDGVANSPEDGKVKGVEIAYQQTYDMLPGFMQYFGIQANYTYLSSNSLPVVQPKSNEPTGAQSGDTTIDVSDLMLPGLSKDTFNFTAFWENDTVSARLAYNYRSQFTLTTRDVIDPYTPILNGSTGTLDGSVFWRFRENMEVGVQAVNLTDEITKTIAVINQDLQQAGRSWFRQDRRLALIFRGTF